MFDRVTGKDIELLVMDDMYNILKAKRIIWPDNFLYNHKIKLLDYMITHYETEGNFKQCKILLDIKNKIER